MQQFSWTVRKHIVLCMTEVIQCACKKAETAVPIHLKSNNEFDERGKS